MEYQSFPLEYESMWFMRNVPHSLGHLNSGSPVAGALWEGLRGTLKVKKTLTTSNFLSQLLA